MPVKCLLIVPIKMNFFKFVKAELMKLARMAGVIHEADHTYSIQPLVLNAYIYLIMDAQLNIKDGAYVSAIY